MRDTLTIQQLNQLVDVETKLLMPSGCTTDCFVSAYRCFPAIVCPRASLNRSILASDQPLQSVPANLVISYGDAPDQFMPFQALGKRSIEYANQQTRSAGGCKCVSDALALCQLRPSIAERAKPSVDASPFHIAVVDFDSRGNSLQRPIQWNEIAKQA
jgi:hypothetical protein